jgi:ribonuclease R
VVPANALNGAAVGDLVLAEIVPGRRLGLARAEVRERIGRPDDPSTISLMTAVGAGLPLSFPPDALAQAAAATPVELGRRRTCAGSTS